MTLRKLKTRSVYVFVGLIIIGLIGVQMYWINNSIKLQNARLEDNLKEDLQEIVKYLEEQNYCFSLNSKAYIKKGEGIYILKQKWKDGKFIAGLDTLNLYNVFYHGRDTFFVNDKSYVDDYSPATLDVTLKFSFFEFYPNVKRFDTGSYNVAGLDSINYRDVLSNKFSISDAIDMRMMDSLVKTSLVKNKLDTIYQAGFRKAGDSNYEYLVPGTNVKNLAGTGITVTLLNDNKFNKPYELLLYVPNSFNAVIGSMSVMMLSSILIIILLIGSYAYFVKTIFNQKKLSEMKSTFINNITHEFRTPITNINLAIENWRDSKANRNGYYLDIIEEENRHMERNVEQILEIATIEYPGTKKRFGLVNMSELIAEVIDSFEIQLINTGGTVEFHFNEKNPCVAVDGDQIKNMLHNLVDNAIKYRQEAPHISISTYDTGNNFVIQIDDNGIGMSPEIQKHIFKRFYRGLNGDTHDVKGFGLGLSYVKYIVDAHNGEIFVKSKAGKGTKFTIYLPKEKNINL